MVHRPDRKQNQVDAVHGDDPWRYLVVFSPVLHQVEAQELIAHLRVTHSVLEVNRLWECVVLDSFVSFRCRSAETRFDLLVHLCFALDAVSITPWRLVHCLFNANFYAEVHLKTTISTIE